MGLLEHYFFGKRNLKVENHWEELDSGPFRITKPTVICFGGNQTIKPADANYICKVAQGLVGIKDPVAPNEIGTTNDVDFVGIAYGIDDTTGYGKNQKISDTSSLTDEEIAELALNIFAPLYFDEKGHIRPQEQILKNFNQITFFSHCYGAAEVNALIYKVYHNMTSVGIDKATAEAAIGQLYSVSYAPWQIVPCPGLQVIPEKDNTVVGGPALSKISSSFIDGRYRNIYQGEGTVAFKENDDTISLIVSNVTKDEQDEHPISFIARNANWQMQNENIAYGDEVSMAMGVALSYSIASAIQNRNSQQFTPKPTADEILGKVQSILGKTQNNEFAKAIEDIKEI